MCSTSPRPIPGTPPPLHLRPPLLLHPLLHPHPHASAAAGSRARILPPPTSQSCRAVAAEQRRQRHPKTYAAASSALCTGRPDGLLSQRRTSSCPSRALSATVASPSVSNFLGHGAHSPRLILLAVLADLRRWGFPAAAHIRPPHQLSVYGFPPRRRPAPSVVCTHEQSGEEEQRVSLEVERCTYSRFDMHLWQSVNIQTHRTAPSSAASREHHRGSASSSLIQIFPGSRCLRMLVHRTELLTTIISYISFIDQTKVCGIKTMQPTF